MPSRSRSRGSARRVGAAGSQDRCRREDPMKGLLERCKRDAEEEEPLSLTRKQKAPRLAAGLSSMDRARGRRASAQAITASALCMKSSKPASVKRNHRFCVAAECGVVVVDLLPRRVLGRSLAVQRHRRLEGARPSRPSGSGTASCRRRPAASAPPGCARRTWPACRCARRRRGDSIIALYSADSAVVGLAVDVASRAAGRLPTSRGSSSTAPPC